MSLDFDKLSLLRAIESSGERNSMARKRYQKGQLWLEKDGWHGRWREDVIVNGVRQPDPYGEWVLQKVQLETGGNKAPIPEEVLAATRATWPRIVIHATREFERQRPRRQGLIGTLKDYPTKRLAQRALDECIAHVNKISYRPMPTASPPYNLARETVENYR
jgi:hypothetical protein